MQAHGRLATSCARVNIPSKSLSDQSHHKDCTGQPCGNSLADGCRCKFSHSIWILQEVLLDNILDAVLPVLHPSFLPIHQYTVKGRRVCNLISVGELIPQSHWG